MDANNITLTEKYDFVIISNLIGFVEDIQVVFEQVQKVCHPNTKIIVQYYNSLWEPVLKFAELHWIKN
jgi:2-polyprenyl-3-methyl-5-hydroxy-6-metoxy-1,4-benzoquinol methylase